MAGVAPDDFPLRGWARFRRWTRLAWSWRQRRTRSGPDEDPVGPSEYSGADADRAGLTLLQLTAESRNWIHRRVDDVVLEERRTACRTVTLYLTLPEAGASSELVMEDGAILVPLALVAKRNLTLFSIKDETGRTLPALTRAEREHLCRRGLSRLAAGILRGDEALPGVAQILDAIVDEPLNSSRAAIRRLERAARRRARARGALPNREDDALGRLGENSTFFGLASELATNILLIAPVRDPATRLRVLTFSYIEPLFGSGAAPHRRRALPLRLGLGLLRLVGWRAARLKVQARAMLDAASFHIEIEAPAGLQLVDPELVVVQSGPHGALEESVVADARGSFRRAHLLTRPRPGITSAYARASLRLRAETVLRGAFLNASFATLALVAAGLYLRKLEPPAAAPALLLVAPSLMALYVGQRLDSPVSTRMAFGAKLLGTVPALCAFAAATAVVVASGDRWTGTLWWVFTGASGVVAAVLAVSTRLARWRPEQTDVGVGRR